MRKRSRLIITALISITTAVGSLAYFTDSVTETPNSGELPFTLNITNAQVTVTAGVGDGTTTPTWSYDVARLSTSTSTYGLYGVTDTNADTFINESDTGYVDNYLTPNRSMNITGIDPTGSSGDGRVAIGAEVLNGTIANARPGDALVVGRAGGVTTDEGITVKNDTSSFTVKIKVLLNTDAASQNTIKYID